MEFIEFFKFGVSQFLGYTGFANVTWGHICMIAVGIFLLLWRSKKLRAPFVNSYRFWYDYREYSLCRRFRGRIV